MFVRKIIPIGAVLLCVCAGASFVFAQEGPSEEELESARLRLQQALQSGGLPPVAFESDPVPDWAVPNHEPKVLAVPSAALQPHADVTSEQQPTEKPNTETVDPNILSTQQEDQREQRAQQRDHAQHDDQKKSKRKSAAKTKKPKLKKPAVARKKETPKVKTGRAVANNENTAAAKPKTPSAPPVVLPETLRP